ncbi:hypothetical protein [Variovorax sp. UMC13]|uniref:hypothetical protein n=1 Tax=Variovorax sp. UMC13 TaxID=1862326 RepID=UPI0016011207|nr:hypothetical protein [Variovorax sp. UMC13]
MNNRLDAQLQSVTPKDQRCYCFKLPSSDDSATLHDESEAACAAFLVRADIQTWLNGIADLASQKLFQQIPEAAQFS